MIDEGGTEHNRTHYPKVVLRELNGPVVPLNVDASKPSLVWHRLKLLN